jgi:hypothetical protein
MKKIYTLLFALVISVASYAQMIIPGEIFSANPARYNGRKLAIKNIEIVKSHEHHGPAIGGPAGTFHQGAPGPIGSPQAPAAQPCRPPRGFSPVEIKFIGDPEFRACFFMADNMKTQLDREMGHESAPAIISFRGDSRMGYHITLYRLGH